MFQGMADRLADTDAAGAMRSGATEKLTQSSCCLMKWRGDATLTVDAQARERVTHSGDCEHLSFDEQRGGMHYHGIEEQCLHASHKGSRAEL